MLGRLLGRLLTIVSANRRLVSEVGGNRTACRPALQSAVTKRRYLSVTVERYPSTPLWGKLAAAAEGVPPRVSGPFLEFRH